MILPDYDRTYFFYFRPTDTAQFKFTNDHFDSNYNEGTMRCVAFKVDEEEMAASICTFSIIDPAGITSKIFRRGQQVTVKWGMKFGNSILDYIRQIGPNEIDGPKEREMSGFVVASTFSFRNGKHVRDITVRMGDAWFTDMTRRDEQFTGLASDIDVVKAVAAKLKMTDTFVDFPPDNNMRAVMRQETYFAFLRRIANQHDCVFNIYYVPNKGFVLLMQQWTNITRNAFQTNIFKGLLKGKYHVFDYGTGGGRVNIIGDPSGDLGNGTGFGSVPIFVQRPGGQVELQFQASDQQTTVGYTLNTAALEAMGESQSELLDRLINAAQVDFGQFKKDLDTVGTANPLGIARYFVKSQFQTVPEQNGWQFNFETVPNPMIRPMDTAWLGPETADAAPEAFLNSYRATSIPPDIKSLRTAGPNLYWRVYKSTWSHDASGVKHEVKLKR